MKKKIIIIGAGIAGLSAGCYGQINGYETEIYEMHSIPGGLCTAWNRKGYTFDGCIHWLMGVNPHSIFYKFWDGIGALKGKEFINHDIIWQIDGAQDKKLILYSNIDRLEEHLLELSPADSVLIREVADAVRRFAAPGNASGPNDNDKYKNISMYDFAQQIKDPFLREALLTFAPGEYRVHGLIFQLAAYNNKDACWPIGGSLEFARGIESRYLALGGKILYNAKVDEITVADSRVTGIRLADGSVHNADFVISAADGYATIFSMLKGKYINDEIKSLYSSAATSPTSIQVSLGVDCDLSDQPHCVSVRLEAPFNAGGVENARLLIKNYCYDKTMCPPGKSAVTSLIYTEYGYWEKLYKDPEAYRAEKKKISDKFAEIFERRFPAARGKIEVVDVATPITYHRYTGVWKGVYSGWKSTPENSKYRIPTSLPGLKCFYMAGQWASPAGGLPTALMTGVGSIMRICREDKKDFISS